MNNKVLYLFTNTRSVINAQKVIVKHKLDCRVVPVPRRISSECGMSLETHTIHEAEIDSVLIAARIVFNKHHFDAV